MAFKEEEEKSRMFGYFEIFLFIDAMLMKCVGRYRKMDTFGLVSGWRRLFIVVLCSSSAFARAFRAAADDLAVLESVFPISHH